MASDDDMVAVRRGDLDILLMAEADPSHFSHSWASSVGPARGRLAFATNGPALQQEEPRGYIVRSYVGYWHTPVEGCRGFELGEARALAVRLNGTVYALVARPLEET